MSLWSRIQGSILEAKKLPRFLNFYIKSLTTGVTKRTFTAEMIYGLSILRDLAWIQFCLLLHKFQHNPNINLRLAQWGAACSSTFGNHTNWKRIKFQMTLTQEYALISYDLTQEQLRKKFFTDWRQTFISHEVGIGFPPICWIFSYETLWISNSF